MPRRAGMDGSPQFELEPAADPLLAIDQHRATIIDRIVRQWGDQLATSNAMLKSDHLRAMLSSLRADQLLAASLAGHA